jgi:hypothetical protein
MRHVRQPTDQSLDGHIVDLLLELVDIDTQSCQLLEDTAYGSLMPDSHVVAVVVEHELRIVLVDRVVRQVHVLLLQVGSGRLNVGLSCESCQSLVVHVEAEWVRAAEKDVYSEIKLQSFQQKGPS